jgi:hypothetical protein
VATPINAVLQQMTNAAARAGRAPESVPAQEILDQLQLSS